MLTPGFANVGAEVPPVNMATVPVGEMKMTFEFCESAVAGVQAPLQKYIRGTFGGGVETQSERSACPRSSNLIVAGKVTPFPTI